MNVATYNVNSIRARMGLLEKWLEKRGHDLDVLCLQELKGPEKTFPVEKFEALGYHSAVFGQPRYNGVAICSKSRPEKVKRGMGDPGWDQQKRLISCTINGISILNAYAPHGEPRGGEKYHYKVAWYSFFERYLRTHHSPHEPLLVVGDFNVALEERDVYDASLLEDAVCFMPEEREALKRLMDWGLVDVFRYLHPERRSFTWWNYLGGKIWSDEGMRLDYIFATRTLLGNLLEADIDTWPRRRRKPTPSDHAPVMASFR